MTGIALYDALAQAGGAADEPLAGRLKRPAECLTRVHNGARRPIEARLRIILSLAACDPLSPSRVKLANYLYGVPLATVLVGWVAFVLIFLLRKRPGGGGGGRVGTRDAASLIGIVLVMAGFWVVGSMHRRPVTPIVPMRPGFWAVVALAVVVLVPASLWLVWAALRVLGKQWSIQARVLEGHALVTTGPYRLVRHPIYTAVIILVVAMGLAYSSLVGLMIGTVLVTAGTIIRIRAEERLLRGKFGDAYAEYARRVPALIPMPWRRHQSPSAA